MGQKPGETIPFTEGPAGSGDSFGATLRRFREARGLTQEELAERSGLTARAIGDMERGRSTRPYWRSVRMLTDALELTGQAETEFRAAAMTSRELASHEAHASPHDDVAGTHQDSRPGRESVSLAPRQLPSGIAHISGRDSELAELDELLGEDVQRARAVIVAAISGMPGVGKTTLAVHWARRTASRFPDGQLHANLRGFDPADQPTEPGDIIRGFLEALQVPADQIPASLDAQAALYRTLLASRRMIIVLDNARDAAQVRPLLPGSPACIVLVTSRHQLTSLAVSESAYLLTLHPLARSDAHELLTNRLGAERSTTEPDAVSNLVASCARLPLALSIAAARAAAKPGFPLQVLARELQDRQRRLNALDAGEATASIRAVFSWSYDQLTAGAARMFRVLGVHPGPDVSMLAAASMAAVSPEEASRLLSELTQSHLMTEHFPGRFEFHDLLRVYAAERARAQDGEQSRAALRRVLDHYLHTAQAADQIITPARDTVVQDQPDPGVTPEQFENEHSARAWLQAERRVLIAAVRHAADAHLPRHALQLASTMVTFLDRQGQLHDYVATQQIALAAAQHLADLPAQARAHADLGGAYGRLGQFANASRCLSQALSQYLELHDIRGQGRMHLAISWLHNLHNQYSSGLAHCRDALRLFTTSGEELWQARAVGQIGWCHVLLGQHDEAISVCLQALSIHRKLGDQLGEAAVLESIGDARICQGEYQQAVTCFKSSAELYERLGELYYHAEATTRLGDAHQASGNLPDARRAWHAALAILEAQGHPSAGELRSKLDNADLEGMRRRRCACSELHSP
jgi:tetratricopeptide (TPR) repeat protein/transcriptional regulator with XRE-family HTH domain